MSGLKIVRPFRPVEPWDCSRLPGPGTLSAAVSPRTLAHGHPERAEGSRPSPPSSINTLNITNRTLVCPSASHAYAHTYYYKHFRHSLDNQLDSVFRIYLPSLR